MALPPTDLTAVLLAGGDSTRFGDRNKLCAEVDGTPMIRHVVDVARSVSAHPPILVVRRPGQREGIRNVLAEPGRVRFATDEQTFSGPVAGVYGSLPDVETDWTLVCACDMPLLSSRALSWLADRTDGTRNAVVPVNPQGWLEPLHALYRRDALLAVRDSIPAEAGARALPEALTGVETVSMTENPVDLESSCTNVNTRSELAMLHDQTATARLDGGVPK